MNKKENTTKKVNKTNRIKESKFNNLSEEGQEVKRFIIIFAVIVVLVVGLYFLTQAIVNKRDNTTNNTTTDVEISYDTVNVGMILNRPYSEYYVLIYDTEDPNATYYSYLLSTQKAKDGGVKIYSCDLADTLNSSYKKETSNPNAKTVSEFAFDDLTLLYIKNGKVSKYYDDLTDIEKILK